MGIRGQSHCLTFVKDHSDLYFQTSSAAKPLGPSNPNFMQSYYGLTEQQFVQLDYCMGKLLKSLK